MGTETIQVSRVIRASPDRIYQAWLDQEEHSKFTGGRATVEPGVGGKFTAWDGYIQGTTVELEPGRRIVQSWRTSEFPSDSPDSRLEVRLEPMGEDTRLLLVHTEIPSGQGPRYEQGWKEHYLEPLARYFSGPEESSLVEEAVEVVSTSAEQPGAVAPVRKAAPKPKAKAKKSARKAPAKRVKAKKPSKKKKKVSKKSARKAASRKKAKKSPKKKKKANKKSARKAKRNAKHKARR